MNNQQILQALSMDLIRVAIGYHRGSNRMAERFVMEIKKREEGIMVEDIKPYMRKILRSMFLAINNTNCEKVAEDSLMYSTLIRNYCQKFYP